LPFKKIYLKSPNLEPTPLDIIYAVSPAKKIFSLANSNNNLIALGGKS